MAGIAATLSVFVALSAGYLAGGGGFITGDEAPAAQPAARATVLGVSQRPDPTATPPPPTQAAQPTATSSDVGSQTAGSALPDRTNCDEIYGTQYRSEREKAFFLATCVSPTDPPDTNTGTAPDAGTPPDTSTPPNTPAQPAQVNNQFTWGGSGGDYIAFATNLCQSGTVGYTLTGEYAGRSFCTQSRVPGMPPFSCPEGAEAKIEEATANGAVIGEVFCIIPNTPTPGG